MPTVLLCFVSLCNIISFMWPQIATKFMGPTWGSPESAPDGPQMGPMNLAIKGLFVHLYIFTIISNTPQQQARYLSDVIRVCACFPGGRQGPQGFIITCRLRLVNSGGVNELTNVWSKRNIGPGTIDLVQQVEVHSNIKKPPTLPIIDIIILWLYYLCNGIS